MSLDLTAFDDALKDHYSVDRVVNMTYTDHPLWAMLTKYTRFGGRKLPIPIRYANTQGRARIFADAQEVAGKSSTYNRVEAFEITRKKDYALAQLDGETIDATMGAANSFLEAAMTEIDSAFASISASLAHALYRDGTGVRGSIASTDDGTEANIILSDTNDIVHFEVGMALEIWDADGDPGRVRAASFANCVVSAVDRDTGKVTLPAVWNTAFGITLTSSDKILQYGDAPATGTTLSANKVIGLQGWLPWTAPTSGDSFNGVDRSVDTLRLAGVRSDGSAKNLEDAYIDALALAQREGGRANIICVTFEDWAALEKELGSKKVETTVNITQEIGFRGLKIIGPKGPAVVVPDQDAVSGYGFGLELPSWKFYSLGMAPRFLTRDGNKSLRLPTADGEEYRLGYYGDLGCNAPGHNFVVKLPARA